MRGSARSRVALSACGGRQHQGDRRPRSGKTCGDVNIAVNPWTGYEADAYVVGHVAETKLGCTVNYQDVKEEVGWQGFASRHRSTRSWRTGATPTWSRSTSTEQKTVEDAGLTGNDGIIGWYVPPWMAKKYPDITDWKNLNKYADLFKTSESGGKGQLLDGDPSYVTNDEALVKNLKLNYKVVVGGSEAALIQSFRVGGEEQEAAARLLLRSRSGSSPRCRWSRSTCRSTPPAATPTRRRSPATTRRTS